MEPPDPEREQLLGVANLMLIEKIGTGGMSEVWKAWDTFHQRIVAVKILDEKFSESADDVELFRAEFGLLHEIHHPGVIEAYDFGRANDRWYMTLEFVDGYTFDALLKRKGKIEETDCLLICESVARALDHAWNDHGVVHCDIKPENIMINTQGIVKLTDMGISHRYQYLDGRGSPLECIFGTPAYISPEQVYGDVELDCRTDIYSLGATLYHLSTGRVLFPEDDSDRAMIDHCDEKKQAPDARMENPWLTEGFVQLLEAMLVKNRDYRISCWNDVYTMSLQIEQKARFKPRPYDAISSMEFLKA